MVVAYIIFIRSIFGQERRQAAYCVQHFPSLLPFHLIVKCFVFTEAMPSFCIPVLQNFELQMLSYCSSTMLKVIFSFYTEKYTFEEKQYTFIYYINKFWYTNISDISYHGTKLKTLTHSCTRCSLYKPWMTCNCVTSSSLFTWFFMDRKTSKSSWYVLRNLQWLLFLLLVYKKNYKTKHIL